MYSGKSMYQQIYKMYFASAQLALICLARCPAASPDGDYGNMEKLLEERVAGINNQDSCIYSRLFQHRGAPSYPI